MHRKALLVSIFLFLLPFIHAVTVGDVNSNNEALAEEAANFNNNAKQLLDMQAAVNNIATFAKDVNTAAKNGQGVKPAKGDNQEETVAEPWNTLCTNIRDYMTTLASKSTELTVQKTTVEGSLKKLSTNFNKLQTVVEGAVSDGDYKNEIVDDGSKAASEIRTAVSEYA